MTKARAVINSALRKLGVVGGTGRRTATNQEYADCLPILASLYRTLITGGAFGRLRDVVPRGDYVAGENQRVFRRYNEAQEILFPDLVSWCGSCGYIGCVPGPVAVDPIVPTRDYGRKPYGIYADDRRASKDGAVVTLVDEFSGQMVEAIYDGQRKVWVTINDLDYDEDLDEEDEWSVKRLNEALNTIAPLSHRDNNGLVCYLATLLADDFAAEIPSMVMLQAQQFKHSLTGNYSTFAKDDYECL
jgi:hypothetical protein